MIRVAVVDAGADRQYFELIETPIVQPEDFRCSDAQAISFELAREISEQISRGEVWGYARGRQWFRQAGG